MTYAGQWIPDCRLSQSVGASLFSNPFIIYCLSFINQLLICHSPNESGQVSYVNQPDFDHRAGGREKYFLHGGEEGTFLEQRKEIVNLFWLYCQSDCLLRDGLYSLGCSFDRTQTGMSCHTGDVSLGRKYGNREVT